MGRLCHRQGVLAGVGHSGIMDETCWGEASGCPLVVRVIGRPGTDSQDGLQLRPTRHECQPDPFADVSVKGAKRPRSGWAPRLAKAFAGSFLRYVEGLRRTI